MTNFFTYTDRRSGDRYDVDLDASGEFEHARRYVGDTANNPIEYDHLWELPEHVRIAIDQRIHDNRK